MSQEKLDVIKRLADLLLLEETKSYNVSQLATRFASVEDKYRHDQVIRNVGGVLETMAKRNPDSMIDRFKIAEIYNTFTRLDPNSEFKQVFADLLPNKEVEEFLSQQDFISRTRADYVDEARNTQDVKREEVIEVSELEAAVDQPVPVLGLEKFNPADNVVHDQALLQEGSQILNSQLSAIGCNGARTKLKYAVNSCLVYVASIPTPQGNLVVNVPVEIKEGRPQLPEVLSNGAGTKLYRFSTSGLNAVLFDAIEEKEDRHLEAANKIRHDHYTSDIRTAGSETFEVDETDAYIASQAPVKLPSELSDVESILENAVLRSQSQYTEQSINSATQVVANELAKLGYKSATVHFAQDTDQGMMFDATLQTGKGKVDISIPVEVVEGNILFPTKFAADDGQVRQLTAQQINELTKNEEITTPAKYSALLVEMGYNDLRKIVHNAVFDRKLGIAQEALRLIKDKFGSDAHNNSVSDFQEWCEQASQDYTTRCGSCPFYRPAGKRGSTSSKDQCGLLNTSCSKVVKVGSVCKKASVSFDAVRDEGYKGIISGHDIRLS